MTYLYTLVYRFWNVPGSRHVTSLFPNGGHMTRALISNMAAVLGKLLVLFSGISGLPLGHEAKQARSCGYEVSFVRICALSDAG